MFTRTDLAFTSHGITCKGYLYMPSDAKGPVPCVIMGHGFAATRECGIAPFAEAFANAGYAAFMFDYRHFGASGGEPRQLLMLLRCGVPRLVVVLLPWPQLAMAMCRPSLPSAR